jgi:hypothetical protein
VRRKKFLVEHVALGADASHYGTGMLICSGLFQLCGACDGGWNSCSRSSAEGVAFPPIPTEQRINYLSSHARRSPRKYFSNDVRARQIELVHRLIGA